MSRSLCDTVAKEAGVISTAETFSYTLTSEDRCVVLATDGLWEFMSSQEGNKNKQHNTTQHNEFVL